MSKEDGRGRNYVSSLSNPCEPIFFTGMRGFLNF